MTALPDPWTTPTVAIIEAGNLLNMGRTTAYERANSGDLPTIPTGSNRRRVPTAALYQLLGLPLPERPAPG
jgi:hypothetical protein